jgi:HAD superfamily hydrolase (TIGR01549 family)
LTSGFIAMLKAVLFDLDNTLILFEEVKFMQGYFPALAARFADIIPEGRLADKLMKATLEMHKNDGRKSNREFFLESFCDGLGVKEDEVWARFELFYMEDFDAFRDTVMAAPGAGEVFSHVHKRGLKIVIATNPLWPLIVQQKRLFWAGLDDIDIELITHIDNMSFCKPQLGYFRQICDLMGLKPEECLMVGDDPANDMVAARIGMKTYQATDSHSQFEAPLEISKQFIGNNLEGIPPADFSGPLADVPQAINSLLGL